MAVKSYNTPEKASAVSAPTKGLGLAALAVIIYVHLADLGGKLSEVPYLGYAYIALVIGSLLAAVLILRNNRQGWTLGGALALGAIIAYALTRTTGLPSAMDDIGNWLEPLGVVALISEAVMVALSGYVLGRNRRTA